MQNRESATLKYGGYTVYFRDKIFDMPISRGCLTELRSAGEHSNPGLLQIIPFFPLESD
jgi:hypothetical protein